MISKRREAMLRFVLVVLLATVAAPQKCDVSVFKSVTDFGVAGAQLLYSVGSRSCVEPGVSSTEALKCTGTYTRYAFAVASAVPNRTEGVCYSTDIRTVAPVPLTCLQYYGGAELSQPTAYIDSVSARLMFSAPYRYYPLVDTQVSVPFTYAQLTGATPTYYSPCIYTGVACAPVRTIEWGATCSEDVANTVFGDNSTAPEIAVHCGTMPDPHGEILPAATCSQMCCNACGSVLTNSSFRRYAVGPLCRLKRIGGGQWRVFGGVRLLHRAFPTNILLQKRVNTNGVAAYNFGATGPARAVLSDSGKARAVLNTARNTPGALDAIVGDYVLVCDLDPDAPEDQGVSNPYATNKIQPPCAAQVVANPKDLPEVVSPTATPVERGAGAVPTARGQGAGARFSFLYIPKARVAPLIERYSSQISNFIKSYSAPLYRGAAELPTTCPGSASDYFTAFRNVPGWSLNTTTGKPFITSVCQMTSAVNEYRQCFLDNWPTPYTEAQALIAQTTCASKFPDFLLPGFDITRPQAWVTSSSLVVQGAPQAGYQLVQEVFVDLADDTFQTGYTSSSGFALDSGGCSATASAGEGVLSFVVANTGTAAGFARVQINCTTLSNGSAIVQNANGSAVPLPVQLHVSARSTVRSDAYALSFAAARSNDTVYVTCRHQLVDTFGTAYGPVLAVGCTSKDAAFTTLLAETIYAEQDSAPVISRTAAIVLVVVVSVVVVVAIITIIVVGVQLAKKNKEKQQ